MHAVVRANSLSEMRILGEARERPTVGQREMRLRPRGRFGAFAPTYR